MRLATCFFLIAAASTAAAARWMPAFAHGYKIGALEITHPAIMEPHHGMNCTCAYLRIRNTGTEVEYFTGARISAARDTVLLAADPSQRNSGPAKEIRIGPGETINLRHGWCLFMTGITERLDADMNVIAGELIFERAGHVPIEFMIDARHP